MIKQKKNASDILDFESRLKQKEHVVNENERGLSFNRGFFYYLQQSYLVYECKSSSFDTTTKISTWKSTGTFSGNMIAAGNTKGNLTDFKNDGRMNVYLSGNHFQRNVASIPNSNNVINIYIAYILTPISSTRSTDYTIQNTLFGAMKITKNNSSKIITKDMVYVLMKVVNLIIQ